MYPMASVLGFGAGDPPAVTNHIISSNQTDYNLFTDMGSPSGQLAIVVTIQGGVTITSTVTSTPAFDTGTGWHASTTIKIINLGRIEGAGGVGGQGGTAFGDPGDNGLAGGDALNIQLNVDIENVNGEIWGGGGGGGGGGSGPAPSAAYGGGGGGGAGDIVGGGGAAGGAGATAGSDGTTEAGGPAGSGASGGADGGNGGNPGDAGSDGIDEDAVGGTGGVGGKAAEQNGNSANFLSGASAPNVKGAVS